MPAPTRMATLVAAILTLLVGAAWAADIPLPGKRFVVLDRHQGGSKDKVVFAVRDKIAGITKGAGTDLDTISAVFYVAYANGATAGAFEVPPGSSYQGVGWKANKEKLAKFRNSGAPSGPTVTRQTTVRPDRAINLVAKGLGDGNVLDIFTAGPPAGSVFTAYCVDNDGERNCHCSEFLECDYKLVSKGTAAKLKCRKPSVGDPTCRALQPAGLMASTTFDVDFEDCP